VSAATAAQRNATPAKVKKTNKPLTVNENLTFWWLIANGRREYLMSRGNLKRSSHDWHVTVLSCTGYMTRCALNLCRLVKVSETGQAP
jgi:hypothetical protein